MAYARRAGVVVEQVSELSNLGWSAIDMGDLAEAEEYFQAAAALPGQHFFPIRSATALLGLALVHFLQGKLEAAGQAAEEALALATAVNNAFRASMALAILSLVATLAGDATRARRFGEESLHMRAPRGFHAFTEWALALVHCELQNDEMAWHHLSSSYRNFQTPSSIPRVLAVAAVLLAQQGKTFPAVEILAAVFSDPHRAAGWMELWRDL